jgi:hypothetical protein
VSHVIELLWWHTWWSWSPETATAYSTAYHWFNLLEGVAWITIAILVVLRFARQRQSSWELWYAFAFFAFGLTDFREAWFQQSWLLWIKLANLLALWRLRNLVMRRFYPESRVY